MEVPDGKRRRDGDGNSYVMVMRSCMIICMFREETFEGVRGANGKGQGEEHVVETSSRFGHGSRDR